MKRNHWIALWAAPLLCGGVLAVDSPAPEPARIESLKPRIQAGLAELEALQRAPKSDPVVRELGAAALAYLMVAQDPAKAQAALEEIFALQEMDQAKPNYGNVPWQKGHPEIDDSNAIEFTALPLAALYIKYRDSLPAETRDQMRVRLGAALVAVESHPVPVWYTNIYLMNLANRILLGECVDNAEAVARGKANLERWLEFTGKNGITEYNSAVYAGVQLDVLHTLYNLVKNPEIKQLTGKALDYVWTDAAANYFPAAEAMSGSSSRSYSFLGHDLNVNQYYYLYGFQQTLPGRVGGLWGELFAWANGVWGGYTPSTELKKLAEEPVRVIRQRVGEEEGKDRYNYITPSFALGTSSFFYEHQDRQVSLMLNSPKNLPVVSVVLDPFNAPYGKVRILETHGGHYKILHLRNEISAVQEKGAVLALMNLASEAAKKIGASVATNVILPLQADELSVDGKPVKWGKEAIPVSKDSVIGIREGRAAVAIRLFHADPAMEGHPVFYLRNDGARHGAGRLVAYHSRGKDGVTPVKMLRSGVMILARECANEEEFARFFQEARSWKIEEAMDGAVWKVAASGPSPNVPDAPLALTAALDIPGKHTVQRLVNGQPYEASRVFTVNDRDLAGQIFASQDAHEN